MDNDKELYRKKLFHPEPGQLVIGILFIILGAIFLIGQFVGKWVVADLWPFFLIIGGLIFFVAYFLRHDKPSGYEGMLFPGSYLIILGILFLLMNIFGWYAMKYLWPTFILGVAISLAVMNRFSPKRDELQNRDVVSAIRILTVVALVLYFITIGGLKLWPLALIVIGLMIIFRNYGRKKKQPFNEG
jgi:uncharacterized membrane protein HdeD (DUF308 family)